MRAVLDEYDDRVLLGEIYLPVERLAAYYAGGRGAHLPLNFHLIETPWRAHAIGALIERYEAALPAGAWPNWVLGNHDRPRIASRVGADGARLAAMVLLTLRGTPTLYYGDELGLPDTPIPPHAVRDPRERRQPGLGLGRDPVRAPMPWRAGAGAGFTDGAPWLPLPPDHARRNVETLAAAPNSILNLYRALLTLRRARPALHRGGVAVVRADGDWLIYDRRERADELRIALNFGETRPAPEELDGWTPVLSTRLAPAERSVAAREGVICERRA
jgi:alpha-glucosidase